MLILYKRSAAVAQRKSTSLVRTGSWVRFPSAAIAVLKTVLTILRENNRREKWQKRRNT